MQPETTGAINTEGTYMSDEVLTAAQAPRWFFDENSIGVAKALQYVRAFKQQVDSSTS